jgi:hypothetical protein
MQANEKVGFYLKIPFKLSRGVLRHEHLFIEWVKDSFHPLFENYKNSHRPFSKRSDRNSGR